MDYRDRVKLPSLIVNDNIEINFTWDLWAAEVDLIAKSIKGKKIKIKKEEIAEYLAGILDGIVLLNVDVADKRELAKLAKEREGKSDDYIERYLRGWDSVNRLCKEKSAA